MYSKTLPKDIEDLILDYLYSRVVHKQKLNMQHQLICKHFCHVMIQMYNYVLRVRTTEHT